MDFSNSLTKGKLKEPIRMVIFGKDGVGKTEFASQSPSPIFLCAEQGTGHLDVCRFPTPTDFTHVEEMVKWLSAADRGFKTLVLDTLDWLEPMLNKRCEVELGKELSKIGYNKGYEYALAKTRDFVNLLGTVKNLNIVALAHTKIRTFQDPGTGSGYDRYQLALRDDTANVWRQWADAVLFFDYQVFKRDSEDRFAQGEGKRVMYTEERPSHQAKNRYSLPYQLDVPKGSGWATFENAVKAGGSDPKIIVKEIMDLIPVITDEGKRVASIKYVDSIAENPALLAEFKAKLVAIKNGGVA